DRRSIRKGSGKYIVHDLRPSQTRAAGRLVQGVAYDLRPFVHLHDRQGHRGILFVVSDGEDRAIRDLEPKRTALRSSSQAIFLILRETSNEFSRHASCPKLLAYRIRRNGQPARR